MYANFLLDLPTSCFMRRSFTFCSRVMAFQDRNRKYVLLTQLHVLKGQVTLLHPLSSKHPYILQSPALACFLAHFLCVHLSPSMCRLCSIIYNLTWKIIL